MPPVRSALNFQGCCAPSVFGISDGRARNALCHRRCNNPQSAGRKFPCPRKVVYTCIDSIRRRSGEVLRGKDVDNLEEMKQTGMSVSAIQ